MGEFPVPRSRIQILSDMIDAFLADQGIPTLSAGNPLLSIFEAAAQSDLRSSEDIFDLLNAMSLAKATGLALERKGNDENVFKLTESAATGLIDITDTSFTKIATKLFQGTAAPIVGTVTLNVVDASLAPASGQVYIGRGTANYEGPLAYSAKTNLGTHWSLTLPVGTVKFHNTSESVIFANGGNRVIGPGTIVRTPQANVSNAVEFRTLYSATIPDGETSVTGVQVQAQKAGIIGNVPRGAIKEFSTDPFVGASVTNTTPFSNGQETELDDDYRERIGNVIRSRGLGTPLAITTAVTGITASDENKRISSARLVNQLDMPSTLYVDDGTGYEERTAGVAIESLNDAATGGEQYFEAAQRPVARAFAISQNPAPFDLTSGSELTVRVGGTVYTHFFDSRSFAAIANATAYEVCSSINSDSTLGFLARTADSGAMVVLFAKSDTNEDIEVLVADGTDANDVIGFPAGTNYTMLLYKNDRLLQKDGLPATYPGEQFSTWNAMSGAQSLEIAVDGTPSITYSFTDQDFIDTSTGFSTVGRNTLAAWVAVLNSKVAGVTATENAGHLLLTSNLGTSGRAKISVIGGTMVAAHVFGIGEAVGKPRDYSLDRNTSQIRLETALAAGDRLSIGSRNTRAFVESDVIPTTTLASTAKMWFVVDGDAKIIANGITPSSSLDISVSALRSWGHTLQIDATSGTPFVNVLPGDWLILWDPALDPSLNGVHRVVTATNSEIVVERRTGAAVRSGNRSVALAPVSTAISKVLTTGGTTRIRATLLSPVVDTTNTTEMYDPATKLVTPAASMAFARAYHTATLLPSGKVLVTGGYNDLGVPIDSIELYDPGTGLWTTSTAVLANAVADHEAVLLGNGTVLITGGVQAGGTTSNATQIYTPGSDSIATSGNMTAARARHRMVKLPSGSVLIVGGYTVSGTPLATAEKWTAGASVATGSMTRPRDAFALALVGTSPTTVIAFGARRGAAGNNTYEIYTIGTGLWGAETTIPSSLKIENCRAVTTSTGNVVALHAWDTGARKVALFTSGGSWSVQTGDPAMVGTNAKFDSEPVLLSKADASLVGHVMAIGGSMWLTDRGFTPTANYEEYDAVAHTWSIPDPAVGTGILLTTAGIGFVRSDEPVQEADVSAGTNYTASSFATALDEIAGGAAATYRTNRLRISTNSFGPDGDIALVAQNPMATGLGLDIGDAIPNLTSHLGAIESVNSGLGTPSFASEDILAIAAGTPSPVVVPGTSLAVDASLVGLRNFFGGTDGSNVVTDVASFHERQGSNFEFHTSLASLTGYDTTTQLVPRTDPTQPWAPTDRVYLAAPFRFGASDDLTVLVDNDVAKRFAIKMWRKLSAVGNTYSTTNTLRDADASGVSLARTFGLGYDFNDHAVYMASRAVAFSATANLKSLIRYYRLGPDGDATQVRFANPVAANNPLAVEVAYGSDSTSDVRIRLSGGAARTPTIHVSTKIGVACYSLSAGNVGNLVYVLNLSIAAASRTTNVTTLTLTLPPSITNHGFTVGDTVWVNSSDSNFSSGLKTVLPVGDGSHISYAEVAANASGGAIGTVSNDRNGEATLQGVGVVNGDFLRIADPNFGDSLFAENTVSITGSANGYAQATSGERSGLDFSVTTGLAWYSLSEIAAFQIFANPSQTATAIAAAVNALATAADSKCPITLTLLGSGAGTITQSTPEALDTADAWYTLSDGVNWVKTTVSPGSLSGDYDLIFKNPVNGTLATNADWQNEEIRIVPTTTQNVVGWLNAPTVSGLFTTCSIQASSGGRKVQIATKTAGSTGCVQVQGGLANISTAPVVGSSLDVGTSISTVEKSGASGLSGRQWCSIQNQIAMPKPGIVDNTLALVSWSDDGLVSVNNSIYSTIVSPIQTKLMIEVQGDFIAISDMGLGTAASSFDTVTPGMFIRLSDPASPTFGFPQISDANKGIYRVLRTASMPGSGGTVWIQNPIAIPEWAECTCAVFSASSVMPGDKFVVSTPLFGVANQGTWVVEDVGVTTGSSGDPFTVTTHFKVSVADHAVTPHGASPVLGASSGLVQFVEGVPAKFVMQILGIAPNQDDGKFADVRWDQSIQYSAINAAAGSIISAQDKLAFPLTFASGIDGYSYDTGLLGEANRVVYGDPDDTATYPGVAAAGANINIQGPLVKRITLSLLLRVKSGVPNSDVADRVRGAVATIINQTGIGQPIALSAIVAAAEKVVGVVAVTVLAPAYNSANDLIQVQPQEKPLILSVDNDIQISFVSET